MTEGLMTYPAPAHPSVSPAAIRPVKTVDICSSSRAHARQLLHLSTLPSRPGVDADAISAAVMAGRPTEALSSSAAGLGNTAADRGCESTRPQLSCRATRREPSCRAPSPFSRVAFQETGTRFAARGPRDDARVRAPRSERRSNLVSALMGLARRDGLPVGCGDRFRRMNGRSVTAG
jgi:hypothetical protein